MGFLSGEHPSTKLPPYSSVPKRCHGLTVTLLPTWQGMLLALGCIQALATSNTWALIWVNLHTDWLNTPIGVAGHPLQRAPGGRKILHQVPGSARKVPLPSPPSSQSSDFSLSGSVMLIGTGLKTFCGAVKGTGGAVGMWGFAPLHQEPLQPHGHGDTSLPPGCCVCCDQEQLRARLFPLSFRAVISGNGADSREKYEISTPRGQDGRISTNQHFKRAWACVCSWEADEMI